MASIAASPAADHVSYSTMPKYVQDLFRRINQALRDQFEKLKDTEFAEHFTKSRAQILEAAKGLSGRVLVLGVGAGNDIPLKELAEQFEEVVLVDIAPLTETVLAKIHEENHRKIRFVKADLSGCVATIASRIETIAARTSKEKFWEEANKALVGIERSLWRDEKGPASFVVSSLLSSQLSNGAHEIMSLIFWKVYKQAPEPLFTSYFHAYAEEVEAAHMKDLITLVAPGGVVYFADNFRTQDKHIEYCLGDKVVEAAKVEGPPLSGGLAVQDSMKKHFNVTKGPLWSWVLPSYIESGMPPMSMKVTPSLNISSFILKSKT